jgi:hypothetical protein
VPQLKVMKVSSNGGTSRIRSKEGRSRPREGEAPSEQVAGGWLVPEVDHISLICVILNLLKDVPDELVVLTSADYSELILAESTIEEHLAHWRARGNVGDMTHVKGFDAVTVIRRALAKCPDEYPPSPKTELLFIKDAGCAHRGGLPWRRKGPESVPRV